LRHCSEKQQNRRRGGWAVAVLGGVASGCLMGATQGIQTARAGTVIHFASVTMESATEGWGIDRHLGGQLVHTVNGGRTWTNVTPPGVTFDVKTATQAITAPSPPHNTVTWYQSGAVARTATLLSRSASNARVLISETVDSGQRWQQWTASLPDWHEQSLIDPLLEQLDFANAHAGWLLVGPGYGSFAGMGYIGMALWHTNDGGHTWVRVDQINGNSGITAGPVTFANATHGWLLESKIDHNPDLLYTTDAGRRWIRVPLAGMVAAGIPTVHGAAVSLFVTPANHLDRLEVLESMDDGQHWTSARSIPLPTYAVMDLKVVPTNPQVLWDLSGHTLWRSTNGGRTWTVRSRPRVLTNNPFLSVVNRQVLWAWNVRPGEPSTMARTTNGGQSWTSWRPLLISLSLGFSWNISSHRPHEFLIMADWLAAMVRRAQIHQKGSVTLKKTCAIPLHTL